MKKNIEIIINNSELGAGTRGSSLGPDAILTVARTEKSSFFSENKPVRIKNENHLLDLPNQSHFAKRIDGICEIYSRVMNQIQMSFKSSETVCIISGDHSSAAATIGGIKSSHPDKKIGVIWIDAHADIHSPYTTPSGNIHGMPLAVALNIDNEINKINTPKHSTIRKWEWMKNMAGKKEPMISPKDLVYIGLRDIENEESKLIDSLGIKNINIEELRELGISNITSTVNSYFDNHDLIYLSFDVDSMDPVDASYGTGTPVESGLLVSEASELIDEFCKLEKLKCIEFVEINPCLDKQNKMAKVSFNIIENSVNQLKNKAILTE